MTSIVAIKVQLGSQLGDLVTGILDTHVATFSNSTLCKSPLHFELPSSLLCRPSASIGIEFEITNCHLWQIRKLSSEKLPSPRLHNYEAIETWVFVLCSHTFLSCCSPVSCGPAWPQDVTTVSLRAWQLPKCAVFYLMLCIEVGGP